MYRYLRVVRGNPGIGIRTGDGASSSESVDQGKRERKKCKSLIDGPLKAVRGAYLKAWSGRGKGGGGDM